MRAATVIAAALSTLVLTHAAVAAFSNSASAPQAVTSATLSAPTGVGAANGACVNNKSVQVTVTWTPAGSSSDGYEVLRASTPAGPYTTRGTVSGGAAVTYTDAAVSFSTTYYYVVRSKKNAWRSSSSSPAIVTTLSQTCR